MRIREPLASAVVERLRFGAGLDVSPLDGPVAVSGLPHGDQVAPVLSAASFPAP